MADMEDLGSLAKLEERILATVEQLRGARRETALLKEQLTQRDRQIASLRAERRQIGERLERLLHQIDLLSKE